MFRRAGLSEEKEPVIEHLKGSGQPLTQAAEQDIKKEDSFA